MADGVRITVPKLEKSLARLRRIAPAVDEEVLAANLKSGSELVALQQTLAPVGRTGRLRDSIRSEKATGVEGASSVAVAIYALWRWIYIEFGTVHHAAQPFLFAAYRLLRKRIKNRTKRALGKAIKKALMT